MDESINIEKKEKNFAQRHLSIFGELWSFMTVRKKFWLLPVVIMLLLVGVLIIFGNSSSLSPFIYALI